ncbi:hypothetical protein [Terrarubrum flagellatum]|uniref:hypothetical protein n=1 Tax=Terrirubrum flagellatum TaxID=2895980 RepID=UPI003145610C
MTDQVTPEEIREQLARLRASDLFASSPQLVNFLDYVVEERLAGREAEIKGYTIAVEALGRPPEFDPQVDPIVRVEARRLRRTLRVYYSGAGAHDPIVISMPTGGYSPTFHRGRRAAEIATPTMSAPAVAARAAIEATLPTVWFPPLLTKNGSFAPANDLIGHLILPFARFDEVRVIGLSAPPPERESDVYLVRGRTVIRDNVESRVTAALLAPQTRDILVARSMPMSQRGEDGGEAMIPDPAAVRQFAIDVARPLGVIGADILAQPDSGASRRWLHAMLTYWRGISPGTHLRARTEMRAATTHGKVGALVQAYLAFLAIDERRNGFNPESGDALDRALTHARAAVTAAPASARAQQALMDALFMRGQDEDAHIAAARAIMLNPFDVDILAEYGAWLVQTGSVAQGREKLLTAAAALPVRAPWHDFYLVLSALLLDDPDAARRHAEVTVSDRDRMSLLLRLLAAKATGEDEQARAHARSLIALDASYATDLRGMLSRRRFTPAILDWLTEQLESVLKPVP